MRPLYVAMNQYEWDQYHRLVTLVDRGYTMEQAASREGLSGPGARLLMQRGRTTRQQLADRRKSYIVDVMGKKKTAHRHTPYVISRFFGTPESYVKNLIKELRGEGGLPPTKETDDEWRDDVMTVLRKHSPNVYPSWVQGKKDDTLYVAGRGYMSWADAKILADSLRD